MSSRSSVVLATLVADNWISKSQDRSRFISSLAMILDSVRTDGAEEMKSTMLQNLPKAFSDAGFTITTDEDQLG